MFLIASRLIGGQINYYISVLQAFVKQSTIKCFVTQAIAFDLLNSIIQLYLSYCYLKGSLKQLGTYVQCTLSFDNYTPNFSSINNYLATHVQIDV